MDVLGAGALGGGWLNLIGARETNSANAEQAALNREWQKMMSDTAHQREVADLKAAGLNPILSSKYGGSSTPGGAQAVMTNPYAGLDSSINTALTARKNKEEVENLKMQNDAIEGQNIKSRMSASLDSANINVAQEQVNKLRAEIDNLNSAKAGIELDNILKSTEVAGRKIEESIDKSGLGTVTRSLNRVLAPVGGVLNSADSVKRLTRPPTPSITRPRTRGSSGNF